jgi:hypothetical protein
MVVVGLVGGVVGVVGVPVGVPVGVVGVPVGVVGVPVGLVVVPVGVDDGVWVTVSLCVGDGTVDAGTVVGGGCEPDT